PAEEATNVPNAQLKGICKCTLKPGEKKEVTIHLPVEAFALYDEDARFLVHKGEYRIYIGGQGPDKRSRELTGKTVMEMELSADTTLQIE
ncbi:MAG: fibronectin type III-like domain-contianing protein, partial [Lachnospiraceae bacterium]